MQAHNAIVELGKSLSYTSEDAGLCQGISVSWMKALLIGQGEVFKARIERIIHDREIIITQLRAVKQKVIDKTKLTPDELELLEIEPFYNSVFLHQKPEDFDGIFGNEVNTHDDITFISSFTQSQALEEANGLDEIYSQTNIYSNGEMNEYFSSMAKTINAIKPQLTEPLCFILGSSNHATSLSYDPKSKEWTFMDINQWPPKIIHDTNELTQYIRKAEGYQSQTNTELSCFTIRMFAKKGQSSANLKEVFQLNQKQAFNREHIYQLGTDDLKTIVRGGCSAEVIATSPMLPESVAINLACVAAGIGITSVIEAIAKLPKGFELLNTPNGEGDTPACLAALTGNMPIIEAIAKLPKGFELLNTPNGEGDTPACLAVLTGNMPIIEAIAKSPKGYELLSTRNMAENTPACIAAMIGSSSVIEAIAKLPQGFELLNTSNSKGETPAHIAAMIGKASVIDVIAKSPKGYELLSMRNMAGKTPAHIAAMLGKASVIEAIAKSPKGYELLSTRNMAENTPACIAAMIGSSSVIEAIAKLPQGFELLNTSNSKGETPAHIAAMIGKASVIEVIAKSPKGYELLSTRNMAGDTPACIAAMRNKASVIEAIAKLPQGFELLSQAPIDDVLRILTCDVWENDGDGSKAKTILDGVISLHQAGTPYDIEKLESILSAKPYVSNTPFS